MNDLDLLERFRKDLREPSERVLREAEERLDRLMSTVDLAGARRRRRRWRIPAIAAAVITLLVLALTLPPGTPGAIDPAAAGQLHRFASIALKGPRQPVLAPGQYVYEETVSRSLMVFYSGSTGISFRYFVPGTQERWLGSDGSGRADWVMGQPEFIAEADRAAYERYVASGALEREWGRSGFEWGRSGTTRNQQGELEFVDFSELPTDVDVLKGMIERREIIGGPEGDWETFNLAADILTWSYAPPQLRAALFEVMARLPGVELIGPSEDALGRVGIAVGYTHDVERQEVLFERGSARVLERRQVSVSGDWGLDGDTLCDPPDGCVGEWMVPGPPGTVGTSTTYEVYGEVVDALGDRPHPSH